MSHIPKFTVKGLRATADRSIFPKRSHKNDFMRLHSDTSPLRLSAALAAPAPYGTGWRASVRMPVVPSVGPNGLPHHQYALVRRPMR